MWDPQRLTTLWASMTGYRDSFTFFTSIYIYDLKENRKRKKLERKNQISYCRLLGYEKD
jgi:hypothetical protein